MDRNYKILGQAAPAATTDTVLYTVPAGKYAVVSVLSVLNRDQTSDPATYRVAVVPSGQVLGNLHYIRFDDFIDVRENKMLPVVGLSLAAGDTVHVYASTANLSYTLSGIESTAI